MDNRGFGFVRFVDERSAEDAVKEMTGKDLDGREIQCSIAGEKRSDPPRRQV
jgi:RNA recognition motif-containing protein